MMMLCLPIIAPIEMHHILLLGYDSHLACLMAEVMGFIVFPHSDFIRLPKHYMQFNYISSGSRRILYILYRKDV